MGDFNDIDWLYSPHTVNCEMFIMFGRFYWSKASITLQGIIIYGNTVFFDSF